MLIASFRYYMLPFVYFIYALYCVTKTDMPLPLSLLMSALFLSAGVIRVYQKDMKKRTQNNLILSTIDELLILFGGAVTLIAYLITRNKAFLVIGIFIVLLSLIGLLSSIAAYQYSSKNK